MVIFETEKMTLDGYEAHKIKDWVVWFMTPFGVYSELSQAVRFCKSRDIDPEVNIIPVPVARGENGHFELVRR